MSNIYTGNQYPKSSFVFDKIYPNFTLAKNSVNDDGILLGRYILIKYCDETLSQDRRIALQTGETPITDNEINYKHNFEIDGIPKDRSVFRKAYNGTKKQFYYQEITNLHTTLTADQVGSMKTLTWTIYNN